MRLACAALPALPSSCDDALSTGQPSEKGRYRTSRKGTTTGTGATGISSSAISSQALQSVQIDFFEAFGSHHSKSL